MPITNSLIFLHNIAPPWAIPISAWDNSILPICQDLSLTPLCLWQAIHHILSSMSWIWPRCSIRTAATQIQATDSTEHLLTGHPASAFALAVLQQHKFRSILVRQKSDQLTSLLRIFQTLPILSCHNELSQAWVAQTADIHFSQLRWLGSPRSRCWWASFWWEFSSWLVPSHCALTWSVLRGGCWRRGRSLLFLQEH